MLCVRGFTSPTECQLRCLLPSFTVDALADTDTLEPRPDYYTAVLFQRLMGTRVLSVRVSHADPDLHIYAHCSRGGESGASGSTLHAGKGDVAFAFLNRSPDKSFDVTLLAASGSAGADITGRSEFHLGSANRSDVFGSQVLLNGVLLKMDSWATLPALNPVVVEGDAPLHVASQTVGFAILHGAKAKACTWT